MRNHQYAERLRVELQRRATKTLSKRLLELLVSSRPPEGDQDGQMKNWKKEVEKANI